MPEEDEDYIYNRDDEQAPPPHQQEDLTPFPGGVGVNTAAVGGGAVGAFLLAVVGLVKRRRAKSRQAELDD